MREKIIIGIVFVILGVFGYLGYQFHQFSKFLDHLGECGMSAGPIYGDRIYIDEETLDLDQIIEIPNGKFGLINLFDSLSPKLLKFDKNDHLLWAVEFKEDSEIGIPHQKLSKMELVKNEYTIELSFFNQSFLEPGRIYLTEDYELKYMCLSPM